MGGSRGTHDDLRLRAQGSGPVGLSEWNRIGGGGFEG